MNKINKVTYEYVCDFLKEKDLVILDEYIENMKAKTKFNFRDKQGYKYYACYDVMQRDYMPRIVGTYNPHSIYNIRHWLKLNRPQYMLLSNSYENSHALLVFKCDKHGEFNMNWTNMQQCQNCHICRLDILSKKNSYDITYIKEELLKRNIELISKEYVNDSTVLICKCLKCGRIFEASWQCLRLRKEGAGCPKCSRIRENGHHFNWNGGLTPLNNYLRSKINSWKIDSFKKSEYKCELTGRVDNLLIHHVYGFNSILKETIDELKIEIYNTVEGYPKDELDLIEKLCLEKHYKYGLGICLTSDVHDLFHDIFGKGNNTSEQMNEFILIFSKYKQNIQSIRDNIKTVKVEIDYRTTNKQIKHTTKGLI